MTVTEIDIQKIVQNVLKTLQQNDSGLSDSEKGLSSESVSQPESSELIRIEQRIITADLLQEKTTIGSTVEFVSGGLITPAAKDFIKEKGIVVVAEKSEKAARQNNKTNDQLKINPTAILILKCQSSDALDSAIESILRSGVSVQQETVSSTKQAVERSFEEATNGTNTKVVIATEKIALATHLANQNKNVRGVAVRCEHDLIGVHEIEANLVAVPGNGLSFISYRNILKSLC